MCVRIYISAITTLIWTRHCMCFQQVDMSSQTKVLICFWNHWLDLTISLRYVSHLRDLPGEWGREWKITAFYMFTAIVTYLIL